MTTTASDDIPEEWGIIDDIHLKVYKSVMEVQDVAEHNALVYFADELLINDSINRVDVDPDDAAKLVAFITNAIDSNKIVQKYLGTTYVQDYIQQFEEDDNE